MKGFIGQKHRFRLIVFSILLISSEIFVAKNALALIDPGQDRTSEALSHFEQINESGFGDRLNRYTWSLAVFNDELYAGTWNTLGFYIRQPSRSAQAFRYDSGTEWDRVVDHGLDNPYNQGLRTMIVWDDPDDDSEMGEAIYGTTMNANDGLEVWRTFDGVKWETVVGEGSDIPNGFDSGPENDSGRGMAVFESQETEWLYLGTRGNNGGEIWRTENGTSWEKVTDAESLGLSSSSLAMADMCVYQDDPEMPPALFVGSWARDGFSVIKSYDGVNFETVATGGIESWANQGVAKLIEFNGELWLLGINYISGFDIYKASPGIISGNEDWELVATNGLSDSQNLYAWNAIVYDNGTGPRLYVGTFNRRRGFMLYSITSDMKYAIEVGRNGPHRNGFGDSRNYGARSFAIYNDHLVIGLACIYIPTKVWMAW